VPADSSFDHLMARLRSGDDEAAATVFHRFARDLIALARERLGAWTRPRVDPEDIVQSVFRSFFGRYRDGDWHFVDQNSLWGLLVLVTLRKCSNRSAYLHKACRDTRREVATLDADALAGPWAPLDAAPSPLEATLLTEAVERLLEGLDPPERAIVELSLQGYTATEIARQLGRASRSVRRVREQVRRWLESWANEDCPAPSQGLPSEDTP
jgi:RNA polymerase sigma-70 factor (ECF subfamily)